MPQLLLVAKYICQTATFGEDMLSHGQATTVGRFSLWQFDLEP